MSRKARIHDLLKPPFSGERIEALSFETIDRAAPPHAFSPAEWQVVRRMIHTTGDFAIMSAVRFSPKALEEGIKALRNGAPLYVDSNMIRAGLSLARLRAVCGSYDADRIVCQIADGDVEAEAKRLVLPRSVLAIRKAKPMLDGAIAVFGNAPTALLELSRMMIEEGVRPALVIAAPVGFVHVKESKEELMRLDVPFIVVDGNRGGSPLAVSMVHALCGLAVAGQPAKTASEVKGGEAFDAVVLLGHGSRVPGADQSMERVAEALKATGRYASVTTCNMSRLGPHFEETYERLVAQGARNILVLPYFLNDGVHIKRDIPLMLQEAVGRHPQVRLVLGKNLGFDPLLVQVVGKRIAESAGLPDVRDLSVPEDADFPVPQGQYEFVPMRPGDVPLWRAFCEQAEKVKS